MPSAKDDRALLLSPVNDDEEESALESVPDQHGGQSSFLQFFGSDYRTPKMVIVRSPFVRVPQLLLNGAIFFWMLVYNVVYKLSFLKRTPIIARPVVAIEQPSRNFFSCSDLDLDCTDLLRPIGAYQYCANDTLPPGFGQCQHHDIHEVQPMKYQGSVFIATAFRTLHERKCTEAELFARTGQASDARRRQRCASLWETQDPAPLHSHFVAGAEEFQLIIKHSFTTLGMTRWWSHADAQGFIEAADGSTKRIGCLGSDACSYGGAVRSWRHAPTCGAEVPGKDACFASRRGDVISLAKLLEAANVSLDSLIGASEARRSRRSQGVSLLVDVEYMNSDPADYWQWPWGYAVKYIYRLREMDFEESRFKITKMHHLTENEDERELYQAFGVLLNFTPRGELGFLDAYSLLLTIAAASTLAGMADLFIRKVLLHLYRKLPYFYHVYLNFTYYTRDITPADEQVRTGACGGHGDKSPNDRYRFLDEASIEHLDDLGKRSKDEFWVEQGHKLRRQAENFEGLVALGTVTGLLAFLVGLHNGGDE